jgi:hypothetical protein
MQLKNRGEVVGLRRLRAIWIIANIHLLFAKQDAQGDGQQVPRLQKIKSDHNFDPE